MSPGIDLSGLTLQAGPRLVKDEYTPGSSIVGTSNIEMDNNDGIGTIQHHPIHINMGYSNMTMHTAPGSGESIFISLFN